MRTLALAVFLAALLAPAPARADYVVNTGPGPASATSNYFARDNAYAGEFTLAGTTSISSVEGWFNTAYQNGGTVRIALYSNTTNQSRQDVPNLSNLLYSTTFSVPGKTATGAWYGASGLSWSLGSGTYWIGFEGLNYNVGYMPGSSQNPLGAEVHYAPGQYPWENRADNANIGVRVASAAVPVPAAIWLLGSGLLALLGLRKPLRS
jgi:hypothetical protein